MHISNFLSLHDDKSEPQSSSISLFFNIHSISHVTLSRVEVLNFSVTKWNIKEEEFSSQKLFVPKN